MTGTPGGFWRHLVVLLTVVSCVQGRPNTDSKKHFKSLGDLVAEKQTHSGASHVKRDESTKLDRKLEQLLLLLQEGQGQEQQTGIKKSSLKSISRKNTGGNCEQRTGNGLIESPGWPGNYPNDQESCWTISASQPVTLTFNSFDLEFDDSCGYDAVEVTDGSGTTYGPLCGSEVPDELVDLPAPVTVSLTTDFSVNERGFDLQYVSHVEQQQGGGGCQHLESSDSERFITSPGYPGDYTNNVDICWVITNPSGNIILEVKAFDLEGADPQGVCDYDYLSIEGSSGNELGKYCGDDVPSDPLEGSVASPLTVNFHTDYSVRSTGFQIGYRNEAGGENQVDQGDQNQESSTDPCGSLRPRTVSGLSGTIQIPLDTSPQYANELTCEWQIEVPQGKRIRFDITDLDVEDGSQNIGQCNYDYLLLIEEGTFIGRACGSEGWSGVFTQGNTLTVRFNTDRSTTGQGFVARWRAVDDTLNRIAEPECGAVTQTADHSSRIVGGDPAMEGDWPWQVSMLYTGWHNCGGSILNDQWIVTAAHCMHGTSIDQWAVVVGELNRRTLDGGEQFFGIEQVFEHPNYVPETGTTPPYRDIALLKLKTRIQWHEKIRPICLPTETLPDGNQCWTSGWGATEGTADPTRLQEIMVPLLPTADCNAPTSYGGMIDDDMVCAGYPSGGKDSCQGDSGGPMVCRQGGNGEPYVLYGVTSFGNGCADPNFPGVYARVTRFVSWITDTVANNS